MTFISILDSIFLEPFKALIEMVYFLTYMISKESVLSIIMLAVIMSLIMLAVYKCINRFQEKLRKRRAELDDGITHIKQNYAGDDRKDLLKSYYKRNNYSPLFELNDFLYLIFEIPIFISLFVFLPDLFIFKGTKFLFISNLAKPDALVKLGSLKINVLPFLALAINLASVLLYSKDYSLQSKIQLCVAPVIFFFFLYNAASALVLYWIIYNTFCLLNTVAHKFKKSKLIINLSLSALGLICLIVGIFNTSFLLLGGVLELPIFFYLCKLSYLKITKSKKFQAKFPKKKKIKKPSWKQFLISASAITLLVGLFIPSAYIAASPLEYINSSIFFNPLNYVARTFCTSAGCFLIWLQIFYWFSSKKHKNIISKVLLIAFMIMIIDYMFFGLNLGIISASLRYETTNLFLSKFEVILNSILTVALIVALFFIYKSIRSYVSLILTALVVIMTGMSTFNIIKSSGEINEYKASAATQTSENLSFSLSTTGNNVVVIMLDRALGQYVPYIFNEKPELKEKYDGFTYYHNTLSFGYYTNICTPSLLGGYEYTPVELNKRDDEYLKDKQNEANLVLPRLFSEKGYNVTVSDPPYVDYVHLSDLSIYDEYENINAFYSIGKFVGDEQVKYVYDITQTNFFRFSIMKTLPLLAQYVYYNFGNYNNIQSVEEIDRYSNQNIVSMSKATGINSSFMDQYLTLTNMDTMTNVTSDETNTFLFFRNDLPHEIMLLDAENDYTPNSNIDNTKYDKEHEDRFSLDGVTLHIKNAEQMAHYHSTASSLIQLASWLDYLRETGTYDNTRIIVASDHGRFLDTIDELSFKGEDLEGCCPLLMVKDFGETGFKTSDEFMTNADVATLATRNLDFEAINPFTGKKISMDEKFAHPQYISASFEWNVKANGGKTFKPSKWLAFDSTKENCNIYNQECWDILNKKAVLKTHSFENGDHKGHDKH